MEATTRFTAPELVALAKRAANECFTEYLHGPDSPLSRECAWLKSCVLSVFRNGSTAYDRAPHLRAVMHAALTPDNIASEDALARALLESAVVMSEFPDREFDEDRGRFRADLCDAYTWGRTASVARDNLLDALLAPTEGR